MRYMTVGLITRGHIDGVGIRACRPSVFGNPFKIEIYDRTEALTLYEAYLDQEIGIPHSPISRAVSQLVDRLLSGENIKLLCYCAEWQECHVDILINKITKRLKI